MAYVSIDLEKLNENILIEMARTTEDEELLENLYYMGINGNKDILVGILKNGSSKTKRVVEAISKNVKKQENASYIEVNEEMKVKNKKDVVTELYDQVLVDYVAINPYTPEECLTELANDGIIAALFNRSLPKEVIEKIMTSKNNASFISKNPTLIKNILQINGYKLSDFALKYLASLKYESDDQENIQNEIEVTVWQMLERRKQGKQILKRNKA